MVKSQRRSGVVERAGKTSAPWSRRAAFAVRRMVCEFLKPARIDDLLEVETRFLEWAGARIEIEQTVKRAGDRLFSAQVTVALIDIEGRPKRLPKAMAAALNFHPESEL